MPAPPPTPFHGADLVVDKASFDHLAQVYADDCCTMTRLESRLRELRARAGEGQSIVVFEPAAGALVTLSGADALERWIAAHFPHFARA